MTIINCIKKNNINFRKKNILYQSNYSKKELTSTFSTSADDILCFVAQLRAVWPVSRHSSQKGRPLALSAPTAGSEPIHNLVKQSSRLAFWLIFLERVILNVLSLLLLLSSPFSDSLFSPLPPLCLTSWGAWANNLWRVGVIDIQVILSNRWI